jgi:hypothetical protein
MKTRCFFVIFITAVIFFLIPAYSFGQETTSVKDIANDLSDFSKDMDGSLPFMASIGLGWSNTYIGQLVNIPPHFGIGLSMGMATLKLDNLNALVNKFGYTCDNGFMDKQLFPVYTLDIRVGGFKALPFDVGIKWGFVPYVPIFKKDVRYSLSIYGLDFRWEITKGFDQTPSVALGFEIDGVSGGLTHEGSATLGGIDNFDNIIIGGNATAGPIWESLVFILKMQVIKSFWGPHISIYGGLRLGAAFSKTGYQLIGGNDIMIVTNGDYSPLKDLPGAAKRQLAADLKAASQNGTSFLIDDDNIICLIESFSPALSMYQGVAFAFSNKTYLDIALMMDILHFEVGASIGFRYQH